MYKRKKWIVTGILIVCLFLFYPFTIQSQYNKTIMGPDPAKNTTGMLPAGIDAPTAIPIELMITNGGAVPLPGMGISPISPNLVNGPIHSPMTDPFISPLLNMGIAPISPNFINDTIHSPMGAPFIPQSLIMGISPINLNLMNDTIHTPMGAPFISPSLNMGIPPIIGNHMPPFIETVIPGPMMGAPVAGMAFLEPMMGVPGPMIGIQTPVMSVHKSVMDPPGLMMTMSNPMMNEPKPMINIPGGMMSMPKPMMKTQNPMIGIPTPSQATTTQLLTPPSPTANASGLLVPPSPSPPGNSCIACHGDLQRMTDLGYPQFYFDPLLVRAETGMPARCDDCHLGNPADFTVEGAHIGLLGLLVMKGRYRDIVRRKDVTGLDYEKVQSIQFIRQSNTDDPRSRLRVQSPFHMLLWHDRNLATASWNPDISMQTCGRCHPAQVSEFSTTEMGLVLTMAQYIPWIVPPIPGEPGTHLKVAPQSCSIWTAATIPPTNETFTDDNRLLYNSTSTRIANQFLDPRYPETSADPLTGLQALTSQRNCNKCHPSCLDCHYAPFEENIPAAMGPGLKPAGTHTVTKRPLPMNCMGMGRGQYCHGGAIERRRGDGYVKGGFAHVPPLELQTPETQTYLNTPDIHYNGDFLPPNAICVDCHGPLPMGGMGGGPPGIHGDMIRNPEPDRCAVCHPDQVAAYLTGTHKNLTCGACHTSKIVGYAFNFWAPGSRFGITPNPLDRHARYSANAMDPLLLLDENGMWAPYHIVPHISTHIDPLYLLIDNFLSPRILWRNQPDIGIIRQRPSKDGVAVTGSYFGPDFGRDEGQVMTWLNIDKIAHNITSKFSALPPRNCIECHTPTGTQRIGASFGWNDDPALAYEGLLMGTFDIVADGFGLRIENLLSGTLSPALDPMRGKWAVPGSYIIPPITGPSLGHPAGIL